MKEKLLNAIGYMSESVAKGYGFTHHGSYYGISIWIEPDRAMIVAAKWAPMEYFMSMFHIIEGVVRGVMFPGAEPGFLFKVGAAIK